MIAFYFSLGILLRNMKIYRNKLVLKVGILFYCLVFSLGLHGNNKSPIKQIEQLPKSSMLTLDGNGDILANIAPEQARIPASTLKILTAWLAIKHWGLEHRFYTDFYIDEYQNLWVKGYGDPFLVSEEIDLIAQALRSKGLTQIRGMGIDDQFFANNIAIDGQSNSDNPYDAPLAALSANFNTLYLKRSPSGVESAEPQTPLTAIARQLGTTMKTGKIRININNGRLSGLYFGEILVEKLKHHNIHPNGNVSSGVVPQNAQLIYRHYNSRKLAAVLQAMLRYSTNFIANQIFLMLGAEYQGGPATLEKAQNYANHRIESQFNWQNFHIQEGAGLSRRNRISVAQFIELLYEFLPYRKLLASETKGIYAKTGTLHGVSCYAGFIDSRNGPAPFALFINSPVPFDFRFKVARELQQLIEKNE